MDLIMLKDQFNFVNDNSWEKKKSANCQSVNDKTE